MTIRPFIMGSAMGAMMLWMLHQSLISGSGIGGWAALTFVLAHFAVVGAALSVTVFAVRLSPRWRARLARLHRPDIRHLGAMAIGAVGAAAVIHLTLHGVVA